MMIKSFITTAIFIFLNTIVFSQSKEDAVQEAATNYSIIKVFLEGPKQLHDMKIHRVDYDHIGGSLTSGMKILLPKKEINKLDKLGINYELIIKKYDECTDLSDRNQKAQFTYGSSLEIHPNPAFNILNLSLNDKEESKLKTATISTHFGEIVKSYEFNGSRKTELDVSDLEGGITYLLIVISQDGASFIEKFFKV